MTIKDALKGKRQHDCTLIKPDINYDMGNGRSISYNYNYRNAISTSEYLRLKNSKYYIVRVENFTQEMREKNRNLGSEGREEIKELIFKKLVY